MGSPRICETGLDGFPGFVTGVLGVADARLELFGLVRNTLDRSVELATSLVDGMRHLLAHHLLGILPRLALRLCPRDKQVVNRARLILCCLQKGLKGGFRLDPLLLGRLLNVFDIVPEGIRSGAQITFKLEQSFTRRLETGECRIRFFARRGLRFSAVFSASDIIVSASSRRCLIQASASWE